MTTSGNVTEATVMGLLPFTSYDCFVTANTSVGEGPPSDTKTQRTVEGGECELNSNSCISVSHIQLCIAIHTRKFVEMQCRQKLLCIGSPHTNYI